MLKFIQIVLNIKGIGLFIRIIFVEYPKYLNYVHKDLEFLHSSPISRKHG